MKLGTMRGAWIAALVAAGLLAGAVAMAASPAVSADSGLPTVKLDASGAGPREVEDLTGQSVTREYATAWRTMAEALETNRNNLLDRSFVGVAHEKLLSKVTSQAQNGLRTRIIDHGHNVKIAFYSPEGSTLQLLDTADIEMQVMDGNKVLYTVRGPVKYVAIMSVAESGWRVRELQAVPNF